jgi:beta-phosphoglucomutase-like phosphatase (HAD superfamily)
LARLAGHFQRQPARLALVTASISYEARASMKEVMAVVRERVNAWPIAAEHRDRVGERLAELSTIFDGFVNASEACEHRLKPHRDLYSLALQQMSIPKPDYRHCVGLEDTEPGIVALRAAGIGCAVALPNRDTSDQDYSAAAMVVKGGLPELILVHNLLLADGP